jgi:Holliday junction resolvasome RuvABC endonuclease subunit
MEKDEPSRPGGLATRGRSGPPACSVLPCRNMPKEAFKILGINPGLRYLGIAVLQGVGLRDWRVMTIPGTQPEDKAKGALRLVSKLIDEHEPNVLAIKKLHPARSSRALARWVAQVRDLAKGKGLRVYQYSVRDLEAFIAPGERTNKRRMAEAIACEYPALLHELGRERRSRNAYHLRMFEAVGLASLCFHQQDKH